jgi:hypothetical protein
MSRAFAFSPLAIVKGAADEGSLSRDTGDSGELSA